MPQLQLDTEKLAFGLEQGFDEAGLLPKISGLRQFSSEDQRRYALRMRICNTVAATTFYYLREQGIEAGLFTTEPDLDPSHAIVIAGSSRGNKPKDTVVEGAYSQFLSYVGLTPRYERKTGSSHFPDEKILVFRQADREKTVEWLTSVATEFQEHNVDPSKDGVGAGPLARAPKKAIRRSFATIWEPLWQTPWHPTADRIKTAKRVSRSIPKGTIISG